MPQLLSGQTVLITRAAEDAGALAAPLRALGATVLEAPTIEVGPPADWGPVDGAIARLDQFDWLVLTSTNGVRAFAERLGKPLPETLRIAAVGPKTAEACRALGWEPALVPERTHGEGLAEALAGSAAGSRFLLARGDMASADLPDGLKRAGGMVEEVVVYANRPCAATQAAVEAIAQGRVDWALFASGSAFRNLLAALPAPEALRRVKLASIGPKTSAVIRDEGFDVAVEAATSTMDGLVKALSERKDAPMVTEIEFVDGNTNQVVKRAPVEDVPEAHRWVRVGDESVAIARVVRTTVDAEGRPVPEDQAVRAYIQEFDAEGVMRRETMQVRQP